MATTRSPACSSGLSGALWASKAAVRAPAASRVRSARRVRPDSSTTPVQWPAGLRSSRLTRPTTYSTPASTAACTTAPSALSASAKPTDGLYRTLSTPSKSAVASTPFHRRRTSSTARNSDPLATPMSRYAAMLSRPKPDASARSMPTSW